MSHRRIEESPALGPSFERAPQGAGPGEQVPGHKDPRATRHLRPHSVEKDVDVEGGPVRRFASSIILG